MMSERVWNDHRLSKQEPIKTAALLKEATERLPDTQKGVASTARGKKRICKDDQGD